MNIREFYLMNSNGDTISLNSLKESFMHSVSGLGMEHKKSYEFIGNNFVTLTDTLKQASIEGKIFMPEYSQYREFVRFIDYTPLTLMYVTDDVYYIEASIDKIEKSEKEVGGLYCKVKIATHGLWYKTFEVRNEGATGYGKIYNYKYNYIYSNNTSSTLTMDVASLKSCPTKLVLIGPCTNPSWSHFINGEKCCTGKVNCQVAEGRRLVIDTTTIPYSIKEMDHNGANVVDRYQYSDFSTKRFLLLENGRNIVRVSQEGTNDIKLYLERRELYETV